MRVALLLSVLALAACGADDDGGDAAPQPQPAPSAGAPIPGGGLSVQEALDSELDGPLLVRGYLIERDGELRLCDAILESYPPQCGEPSLRVESETLTASGQPASVVGEVKGGTITVSETAIG